MDRTFLIPKANININLYSPYMRNGPKDSFCVDIFFNYLQYIFQSSFSEAVDAGNEISITTNEK